MEEINNINVIPQQPTQVSVIPDDEEKRQIRKSYNKSALVLIVNIVIFNLVSRGILILICMFMGRGFSTEAFRAGSEKYAANPLLVTLFSCGTPIVSESIAILLGVKMFGLNFKSLATREGYGGGTVMKLITLALGLQLAAGIIAAIIQMILNAFGLESATADLTATSSFLANAIMYFYACLLGPVLEELLYRGVLLQSMRKYNERFAIFLSAAIFGLMHQNYQQFVLGFLLGIPLAVVTIKYNSIIPAICTHIVVNTTTMLTSCLLQYTAPEYFEAALSGGAADIPELSGAGAAVLVIMVLFRIGFAIAGLVVGIICIVKGKNMSRPTPAGKSRTRVIFSSVLWWVVMAAYLFLCFVLPFIMQAAE